MREDIMGRHYLFLVAARTGCVMLVRGSLRRGFAKSNHEMTRTDTKKSGQVNTATK